MPPVIHVAGTNGKGSTIAFLRAMLEAAGKSVHVYTSPNLVRINERFRLGAPGGGVLVSDEELADALAECERANGDAPITMFEIETAAAFVLFARHPADMLLLEVGLGGRLDATNVIERPLASVVTPVSMDHIEFLGDTIEKIAAEKAGIFRAGVPAVIAPQADAVVARCSSGMPRRRARRCMSRASTGTRASSMAGSSIRTSRACSICRRRNCSAAISSTMPAPRSRRCARPASGCPRRRSSREATMLRMMSARSRTPHIVGTRPTALYGSIIASRYNATCGYDGLAARASCGRDSSM